jgi:hypothetical protein
MAKLNICLLSLLATCSTQLDIGSDAKEASKRPVHHSTKQIHQSRSVARGKMRKGNDVKKEPVGNDVSDPSTGKAVHGIDLGDTLDHD